jgi:hypothetical protein
MGLIDDARALIQRQVAAKQERAAKEQHREPAQPTHVPLNERRPSSFVNS